jgi:hypothetical protein
VEETINRAAILEVLNYIFSHLTFKEMIYLIEIGVLYYSKGIKIGRFYLIDKDFKSPYIIDITL